MKSPWKLSMEEVSVILEATAKLEQAPTVAFT